MAPIRIILSVTVCLYATASAQTQPPNCVQMLDDMLECVQKVRHSEDAHVLEDKKQTIMQKCAPDLPSQCKSMPKTADECQQQIGADSALQSIRAQVKQNVSKCFERFRANSASPSPSDSSFSRGPGGPQGMFGGSGGPQDPCSPKPSQMGCVRMEMRRDSESREIGRKLEEKERECHDKLAEANCVVDASNPPLRDCVANAEQPYMQQSMAKVQECIQAAFGNGTASTPAS